MFLLASHVVGLMLIYAGGVWRNYKFSDVIAMCDGHFTNSRERCNIGRNKQEEGNPWLPMQNSLHTAKMLKVIGMEWSSRNINDCITTCFWNSSLSNCSFQSLVFLFCKWFAMLYLRVQNVIFYFSKQGSICQKIVKSQLYKCWDSCSECSEGRCRPWANRTRLAM